MAHSGWKHIYEKDAVKRILSAVLHLGNVRFVSSSAAAASSAAGGGDADDEADPGGGGGGEGCDVANPEAASAAAALLECNEAELRSALAAKTMSAGVRWEQQADNTFIYYNY